MQKSHYLFQNFFLKLFVCTAYVHSSSKTMNKQADLHKNIAASNTYVYICKHMYISVRQLSY